MKRLIFAFTLLAVGCSVKGDNGTRPYIPPVDYTGKVVKNIRNLSGQCIYIEFEDGAMLKIDSHKGLSTRDMRVEK